MLIVSYKQDAEHFCPLTRPPIREKETILQATTLTLPRRPAAALTLSPSRPPPSDNEIVCFLKVQLAEAINLQDKNQMAQIQETTRCVSRFDARTCRKLLAAIAEDYRQCSPSEGTRVVSNVIPSAPLGA